jgi:hypothetical protein
MSKTDDIELVASNLTVAYFQIPAATELTAFSSDEKQRELLQDEVWRVYQEFLSRLAQEEESTATADHLSD